MNISRLLALMFIICLILTFIPIPARAQTGIEVVANEIELNFPYGIFVKLEARSNSAINGLTLIYGTNGKTCQSSSARQTVKLSTGKHITAEWEWDFLRSGVLPPGSQVWWQWEIKDYSGKQLLTDKQTATIADQRHEWQSISGGGVTVLWYEGTRSFGSRAQQIATNALADLKAKIGAEPPADVTISIYPNYEEVRTVLLYSNEWTGGVAIPEHNAMIIGIPELNLDVARDVIPHELAHLVVESSIFNCKGNEFPVWLNEGIAKVMEGHIPDTEREDVLGVLEEKGLPTLASLKDGFSAQPFTAIRSYAQSGMVVEFLIDEYGIEKMKNLLAAFQSGSTIDEALTSVYNLDTNELDNAWRVSLGFRPLAFPTSTPEGRARPTATPIPTLALWNPIQPTATQTATLESSATSLPTKALPTATDVPPVVQFEVAQSSKVPGILLPILSGGSIFLLLALGIIYSRRRRSS